MGEFLADEEGAWVYANAKLCALAGRPPEELQGDGWREALHPEDLGRLEAAWQTARRDGALLPQDLRLLRPDGSSVWLETSASAVRGEHGEVTGWAGVCIDVSARRLSESRYRSLVEDAPYAIWAADHAGNFTAVNRAAEQLSGHAREELLRLNVLDLVHPEDLELARRTLAASSGTDDARVELRLGNGERVVYAEVVGRRVEEPGKPVRFEGIAQDVTERRLLQERLDGSVFHDDLTGLANRAQLVERLTHALERAAPPGHPALVVLDVNNFTRLNGALGPDVADGVLRGVADRLRLEAPASEPVARIGSDEFAIVVESFRPERAIAIARELAGAFERPVDTGAGGAHRISVSVALAFAEPGDGPGVVLRKAEAALSVAKAARNGAVTVFDDSIHKGQLHELDLAQALAEAVENDRLEVHYQPIVSLDTGEIVAVEALVRWLHPRWGWVPPSEFIPIAEADDLIVRIGRKVLTEAVRQAATWRRAAAGGPTPIVGVNVSVRELAVPGFATFVRETLGRYRLPARRLALEITERAFVNSDDRRIVNDLSELRNEGVQLALDDFGTGYSGLSVLRHLPVTALKIDRVFIEAIKTPASVAPVTNAVLRLAKELDLPAIAEGVETQTQADYLRRLGCPAAQGYFFGRPQPAETVSAILADRARTPRRAGQSQAGAA